MTEAFGCEQDQFGDTSGATLSDDTWSVACIAGASKDATVLRAAAAEPVTSDAAWGATTGRADAWAVYPPDTFLDLSGAPFDVSTGGAAPSRMHHMCIRSRVRGAACVLSTFFMHHTAL